MERRRHTAHEPGTPASKNFMEIMSEEICSWEARIRSALTWLDLRTLSCIFLPGGRELPFLSSPSCRNPCKYFVLTGNILEEENDNDCKEQLEDPHG